MSRVAVLLLDGFSAFEFAVPCEVFGIDRSDIASPWYEFRVCAGDEPPLRASAGFTLDTPYRLDTLEWADTIVVPACTWTRAGSFAHADPHDAVLEALRSAHDRGARILSICSGAFLLAAAGLLDGRPATTHWMHVKELSTRYPRIKVDPRVLYVDDGQVLTSAGTAAGIDLCLHVVRQDYGAEVANAVARRMVMPPHREGGQAQYIDEPLPVVAEADPIGPALEWMRRHLAEPLTIEELARRTRMSPRHFARRFRAVTGTTPHQWLVEQRLLLSQRLLETTEEPVERIAQLAGFGSAANLRKHFNRAFATTPLAYRGAFRTGLRASA